MKRWIVFGIGLLMASGAVAGMKVKSKTAPGVDLSSYATYSWRSNHEPDSTAFLAAGSSTARRMEGLGNKLLNARGFTEAASGDQPDLWIRYTGVSAGERWVSDGTGERSEVNWVVDPMPSATVSHHKGALIVELLDAGTGELVWAGSASDILPDSEQIVLKKIDKAIQRILKQLPKR